MASSRSNPPGYLGSSAWKYKLRFYGPPCYLYVLGTIRFRKDPQNFVRSLYKNLLGRDVEPGGLTPLLELKDQLPTTLWRLKVVYGIIRSPEYWGRMRRQSNLADFNDCHHEARQYWIQQMLPSAKAILDLGGGSAFNMDGALLEMGYSKKPEKITIIDFPPDDRVASAHSSLDEDSHQTDSGVHIQYIHDSFTNLGGIKDGSYDMVFAGQVIEHVTLDEGRKVFEEVHRILAPGGYFCLDTPNRKLTKLLTNDLLHPEHKLEYEPDELQELAVKAGFKVVARGAISPMPTSMRLRKFMTYEIADPSKVGKDPNAGFSFFFHLQKD